MSQNYEMSEKIKNVASFQNKTEPHSFPQMRSADDMLRGSVNGADGGT